MKPKHYEGAADPIALMEAQFTAEMLYGFFAGNVLKYVARAHRKNGSEDLDKAADYLQRLRVHERDREIIAAQHAAAFDAAAKVPAETVGAAARDVSRRFQTFTRTGDGPDSREMYDADALRDALARNAEPEEASGS